jgi:hypothetical protein
MRLMICRLFAILLIGSQPFALMAQEYYRWLDGNGTLHVSQSPPTAGVDYEVVSAQTKTVLQKVENSKAQAEANAVINKPVSAQEFAQLQQQVESANSRIKRQNCETARKNRESLTSDTPLAVEQADGQSKAMTDEMRAEQLKVTERQILEFCSPK